MPRASIIIAKAPGDDVDRCLGGLDRRDTSTPEFEVLVVPAGQGEGGIPHAWNAGATDARGERLVFLRANLEPLPHLIVRHLETGSDGALVAGPVDPTGALGPPSIRDCEGGTISIPRELFRTAGGFDTSLPWGAAIELAHRLTWEGVPFRRIPEPVARRDRPSHRQAADERAAAGRGSVALYRHTPALLPVLELGAFNAAGPPAVGLRRVLLTLRPRLPDLEPLLPRGRWRNRWLRFAPDYDFWRGAAAALPESALRRALARAPVILMYHAIGRPGEPACRYRVPGRRFARQMAWLVRRGYRVLSLQELVGYRQRFELPPAKSVVITFDDGYADNYDVAYPVLRAHRFPATFFIVSGCIGRENRWDAGGELAGRAMLSWEALREMADGGMEIGGHTRRHPVLPGLSSAELTQEVAGCRRDLEEGLGCRVHTFAYPFGRLDTTTTQEVAAVGYTAACCSRSGRNDPAVPGLLLRRVEVRGTDPLWRFALAVHQGRAPRRRPA